VFGRQQHTLSSASEPNVKSIIERRSVARIGSRRWPPSA
jgi:hypothetical protein